jgi:putative NADH-flavin reductase
MAVNVAIVKELAERGHEVTVVSPFPEKSEIPNYKNIILDGNVIEKYLATLGKKKLFSTVIVMTPEQALNIISDDLNVPNPHNRKFMDLILCHNGTFHSTYHNLT